MWWKPNRGDTIEGNYVNSRHGKDKFGREKQYHFIRTSASGTVGVAGNSVLNGRMELIRPDDYVKIKYLGKMKGKNFPFFHCYQVYRLEELVPHSSKLIPYEDDPSGQQAFVDHNGRERTIDPDTLMKELEEEVNHKQE